MAIKSWHDLGRTPNTVMDVYRKVLYDARAFREMVDNPEEHKLTLVEQGRFDAVSDAMYRVAAALENTEEVNPSK